MMTWQRLNGAAWRNIWVTGDLHGCYSLLLNKLSFVGFDTSQDLLISVGDLTDRGVENVECMTLVTCPWCRAVRGNHEQMMLNCLLYNGSASHWLMNGGSWFFNLDDEQEQQARALLPHIAALPLVIEVNTQGKKVIVCHADYPDDNYVYGKPVEEDQLLWNRDRLAASLAGRVKEIHGADLFIFGHTPLRKAQRFANQYYIDTGAVMSGNLTLMQIQAE
ncbi:metallophosphoesterase [Pseudescherichia sp.]|uniref:metallophosphoesterase n=1 Tax=Pseudescherichia sp. TaxID=2055881 RepID=UPI00289C9B9F|nr:metallophosphoesterase [Pseudescherichia sp.]